MSLTDPDTMNSDETTTDTPEENSTEPVAPSTDDLRLLEALLFASPSPVDLDAMRQRLPEGADIAALLDELTAIYAPRGVNIVHVGGGWTIRTAADLAPRLKLTHKVARKLSRAAIETLAIVAYHQPVTRAEIEEIRGVVISKGTLDTLMEAGWIVPKGRKQTAGRPVTWVTTEAFLLHFGLASLSDLPGIDELRAAGLIGPRPDIILTETIGVAAEERLPDVPGENDDEDSDDEAEAEIEEMIVAEGEAVVVEGEAAAEEEAVAEAEADAEDEADDDDLDDDKDGDSDGDEEDDADDEDEDDDGDEDDDDEDEPSSEDKGGGRGGA
jgi:segregation and condensation protein B